MLDFHYNTLRVRIHAHFARGCARARVDAHARACAVSNRLTTAHRQLDDTSQQLDDTSQQLHDTFRETVVWLRMRAHAQINDTLTTRWRHIPTGSEHIPTDSRHFAIKTVVKMRVRAHAHLDDTFQQTNGSWANCSRRKCMVHLW